MSVQHLKTLVAPNRLQCVLLFEDLLKEHIIRAFLCDNFKYLTFPTTGCADNKKSAVSCHVRKQCPGYISYRKNLSFHFHFTLVSVVELQGV